MKCRLDEVALARHSKHADEVGAHIDSNGYCADRSGQSDLDPTVSARHAWSEEVSSEMKKKKWESKVVCAGDSIPEGARS